MRIWAALVLGLGVCVGAKADTTYPTGGSVAGFTGSGTLEAVSNNTQDGSYTIVGITGPGVTGLLAPGLFHGNSNQLFPSGSATLDSSGFAFTDTMGDTDFQVDIFGNANGTYGAHIVDSDQITIDDAATFTLGTPTSTSRALSQAFVRLNTVADSGEQEFTFSFAATQPVSATPEPGSFALMGTGMLAAAALVRRRLPRVSGQR